MAAMGLPALLPALRRGITGAEVPAIGPFTAVGLAALVFGSLALLYVPSLTPESLNCDATWSHVVIAQDHAREGRLPFPADCGRRSDQARP